MGEIKSEQNEKQENQEIMREYKPDDIVIKPHGEITIEKAESLFQKLLHRENNNATDSSENKSDTETNIDNLEGQDLYDYLGWDEAEIDRQKEAGGTENSDGTYTDGVTGETFPSFDHWIKAQYKSTKDAFESSKGDESFEDLMEENPVWASEWLSDPFIGKELREKYGIDDTKLNEIYDKSQNQEVTEESENNENEKTNDINNEEFNDLYENRPSDCENMSKEEYYSYLCDKYEYFEEWLNRDPELRDMSLEEYDEMRRIQDYGYTEEDLDSGDED